MPYDYRSVLAPIINDMIVEKRTIGLKYESAEKGLKMLDLYFLEHQITIPELSKETVESFITLRANENLTNRSKRISDIRELARFMNSHGYHAYVYPQLPNHCYRSSFVPYIFTNEEIRAFFAAVDNDTSSNALKYKVLFRILYGTGMRVGEVLSLQLKDVDFTNGTFFIKQGKKNRDRLIPVSSSILQLLQNYIKEYRPDISTLDYIFASKYHESLSHNAVYNAFRKYLWKAGIPHAGRGKGPQVHSFRHTYCVHRLRNWVLEGRDLNSLFPYICAYMGHADTRSTEYYTRLTADLFPDIREKCELFFFDNPEDYNEKE